MPPSRRRRWLPSAALCVVAAVAALLVSPTAGQAGSGPHEDLHVHRAARPGMRPRHIVGDDESGHGLEPHENGLGWNYARDNGPHRGYTDALFNEGPQQGVHDHAEHHNNDDDRMYIKKMWEGVHPDHIPRVADTTFAGKNRPKHRFHHEFVPIEGIRTTMRVMVNGTGERSVGMGDVVTVHAKGVEKHFGNSPGHMFYTTKAPQMGGPFTYKVGSNRLPIGWDVGCRGMRLGEKREFDIPWQEGYGKKGVPQWGLQPHAEILLTIEVLKIQTEEEAWAAMRADEL